jgi:hypothetical protein
VLLLLVLGAVPVMLADLLDLRASRKGYRAAVLADSGALCCCCCCSCCRMEYL